MRDRRLTIGAVLFVLSGLVVHHELADWEHLCAFTVGLVAGRLLDRWHPVRDRRRARADVDHTAASRRAALAVVPGLLLASCLGWVGASRALPATPAAVTRGSDPSGTADAASAAIGGAHLLDVRYPTPSTGGDRRVLVLLPAGYDSSTDRYPVVEILHGRPGAPDDAFTGLDLPSIAAGTAPFIAVVPDGHGPVVSDGDFADTSKQRLGAAVGEDLQRWVDATYRTNGHWGVMGLSAGGYGAAYLADRPTMHVDAVCSLGGYFSAEDPAFAGETQTVRDAASPVQHVAADGARTLLLAARDDHEAVDEAHRYAAAMAAVGQVHDVQLLDGGHDWDFFRAGTPTCLAYLLAGAS
ncbi:MAG: alpha/beta hydrolase-fold protein [Acidimicrobiales bacterium]